MKKLNKRIGSERRVNMKIWRYCKNLMLSSTVTTLFAIWSKEQLHQESTFKMWVILIAVFMIFFMLLRSIDKEVQRVTKERMLKSLAVRKMKGENKYAKTTKNSKRVESTEGKEE